MRWPWSKKHRIDHAEALHAEARAIEDKHRAEAKWLPIAEIMARMDRHYKDNGFGKDLRTALGRKRT
jgi:hypothetical protein